MRKRERFRFDFIKIDACWKHLRDVAAIQNVSLACTNENKKDHETNTNAPRQNKNEQNKEGTAGGHNVPERY